MGVRVWGMCVWVNICAHHTVAYKLDMLGTPIVYLAVSRLSMYVMVAISMQFSLRV